RSGEPARPLIDRASARARLESCLQHALRGERQIVFIEGEPGVGKTTFVDRFVEDVSSIRDFWIARGHSVEGFSSQEPYERWLMAFEQLVRASDGHFVQTLAKRAPTWLLQFPSLVEADQVDTLRRDTFGATRDRMVRELCETLDAVTRDRVLVLVLEDLHWADPSTLDVISSCARRPGPSRLLLIGTVR